MGHRRGAAGDASCTSSGSTGYWRRTPSWWRWLCHKGGAGAADRRGRRRRVRGRARPGPAGPHQLGTAPQARVRHRHAALTELRRREAEDHRRHPGAPGDREDPRAPGAGPAAAAQGAGARGATPSRRLSRACSGLRHTPPQARPAGIGRQHRPDMGCEHSARARLRVESAKGSGDQGEPWAGRADAFSRRR
jgi:hypothetical protein